MRVAIYPGSFDPVTNGHLDIIKRASGLFDKIIVSVLNNSAKSPLFSVEERVKMLEEVTKDIPNVEVLSYQGLLVDALAKFDACAVIRGLRAVSDFEYEFQMALMNRELNKNCETVFMMPSPEYSFVSSRLIKEIARCGGDISTFVPDCVARAIHNKFNKG